MSISDLAGEIDYDGELVLTFLVTELVATFTRHTPQ